MNRKILHKMDFVHLFREHRTLDTQNIKFTTSDIKYIHNLVQLLPLPSSRTFLISMLFYPDLHLVAFSAFTSSSGRPPSFVVPVILSLLFRSP